MLSLGPVRVSEEGKLRFVGWGLSKKTTKTKILVRVSGTLTLKTHNEVLLKDLGHLGELMQLIKLVVDCTWRFHVGYNGTYSFNPKLTMQETHGVHDRYGDSSK